MAYKADTSTATLSILVDGVATPVAGDVQAFKLLDGRAGSGTPWNVETDGAARVVADAVSAANVTNVASVTSVATLVAANAARRGLYVYNDSTANLYLKYGSGASLTSFTVKIPPSGYYEMPDRPTFTGLVSGIWDAVAGNARVTEV